MKILLYLCEKEFEDYIARISSHNDVYLCVAEKAEKWMLTLYSSFVTIEEAQIGEMYFDYYIIMSRDILQSEVVEERLLQKGIVADKILRYCFFEKEPRNSAVEAFMRKGEECDSIMFGMSHSYGGCIEALLRGGMVQILCSEHGYILSLQGVEEAVRSIRYV